MKGITIWQPWAQLIALGEKEYETRKDSRYWRTTYRGRLAIHAGKQRTEDLVDTFFQARFIETFKRHGITQFSALPLGSIVAIATLSAIYNGNDIIPHLSVNEQAFGWYGPGRLALRMGDVIMLPKSIPCRGQQGFWHVSPEIIELIDNSIPST